MSDVPFLGCKISLISKCDIRYEGILYSIDPKESTIALSKVRSYGTEDRVTGQSGFVSGNDHVYEYIIFRAGDVKDLRVDAPEPPGLTDPAIIQAQHSVPPSLGHGTQSASAFGANLTSTTFASANISANAQKPSVLNKSSVTANTQLAGSNVADAVKLAAAALTNVNNIDSSTSNNTNSTRDKREPRGGQEREQNRDINRDQQRDQRDRNRGRDHHNQQDRQDHNNDRRGQQYSVGASFERRSYRKPDQDDKRVHDRRNGPPSTNDRVSAPRGGHFGDHRSQQGRFNQSNSSSYYQNRRGPPGVRRGPMRRRSGERTSRRDPLRFDGEFDFDKANQEFQELEEKLNDLTFGEGNSTSNGQTENRSSQSNNANSSSDRFEKDTEPTDFYDKTRSFFDNISCEALERSQGKMNKPDWRKERQTNAETFGVSGHSHHMRRGGGFRGGHRGQPRDRF